MLEDRLKAIATKRVSCSMNHVPQEFFLFLYFPV